MLQEDINSSTNNEPIEGKLIRTAHKTVNALVYLFLMVLLIYALTALWDVYAQYRRGGLNDELTHLKPGEPDYDFTDLLALNPDVCGWLSLDGTHIDYPVLQGKDNAEYLDKDIYRKHYVGGSIFLDYRCKKDFTDSYSLIHGHHMDGGVMFGDLVNYEDCSYFDAHTSGTLYTPDTRYKLEIYACLRIDAYDSMIYTMGNRSSQQQEALMDYIKKQAVQYRELNLTSEDQIVALSTCSSAFTNSRTVLIAKMENVGKNNNGEIKNAKDKLDEKQ